MSWYRNEIWLDTNMSWFREASGGSGGSLAIAAPSFLGLPGNAAFRPAPNGLAESRRRRAELRRRRFERRTRAAALVIAPAAILPFVAQRLGGDSTAEAALAEDSPTLERAAPPASRAGGVVGDAVRPRPQTRADTLPAIHWHRATSRGLHYAGSLSGGTQLPVEGVDWVTWNPVEDHVPNEPNRLHGHEHTIRAILDVLAGYRAANPDAPRVVVGDISYPKGGPMEAHVSHQNGLDVDLYYPRLDRTLRAPRLRKQVDLKLTQDLLDRFVAAGAQKVFVGYSIGLRGPGDVVVPYPNHEDHMHVRFRPPAR